MIKRAFFGLIILAQLILTPCFAENNSDSRLASIFAIYQKSYQAGDYEAAKTTIKEALKTHPNNSYLIYNLGLVEYKLGKVGLALGNWRKALSINPQLDEASGAIRYARSHMATKPLTKNTDSTWVWLEKLIIDHLSFNFLWPLFLISFLITGIIFIRYLGAKKKAFENDDTAPMLGAKFFVILGFMITVGVLSFFSYRDLVSLKATAIASPTSAKTGPNLDFATLFDLPEGTEVVIKDKDGHWYKVEDPTGRIGWTNEAQLLLTNTSESTL